MCGISAIITLSGVLPKHTNHDLQRMNALLHHRGPDDRGYHISSDHKVGLAHTRLAIMDPQNGQQPMIDAKSGVALTYNGEIYDCDKLRSILSAKGFHFETSSDTEVVLKLYLAFGTDMLRYMNGEFAFVLYDQKRQRTLVARDRFGIKPLLYHKSEKEINFASEAKAILGLGRFDIELSHDYLLSSLMGNFIGNESFFKHVKPLPPAHYMVIENGDTTIKRYWSPDYQPKTSLTLNEAKDELHRLMVKATKRRLVADTPVGSYLSGGLDSTYVTSIAAAENLELNTYTIGFKGADFNESDIAMETAAKLGIHCSPLMTTPLELAESLCNTLWHSEIPMSTPQPAGMTLLSKHIHDSGTKVCLSGDGADELFCGYAYFKLDEIRNQINQGKLSPSEAQRLLSNFESLEAKNKILMWYPSKKWSKRTINSKYISSFNVRYQEMYGIRKRLFSKEILDDQSKQYIDTNEFYSNILSSGINNTDFNRSLSLSQMADYIFPVQGDRMQMANGIEARVPFLDLDVAEFAFSLPPEYLMNISEMKEKHIVHKAASKIIPSHLNRAHKQAYVNGFTWDQFTDTPVGKEMWEHYMSSRNIKESGMYNPFFIKSLAIINKAAPSVSALKLKTNLVLGSVFTSLVVKDIFRTGSLNEMAWSKLDKLSPSRLLTKHELLAG